MVQFKYMKSKLVEGEMLMMFMSKLMFRRLHDSGSIIFVILGPYFSQKR